MSSTPTFKLVLNSFLRPLSGPNPTFKEFCVYQIHDDVPHIYDALFSRQKDNLYNLSRTHQTALTLMFVFRVLKYKHVLKAS